MVDREEDLETICRDFVEAADACLTNVTFGFIKSVSLPPMAFSKALRQMALTRALREMTRTPEGRRSESSNARSPAENQSNARACACNKLRSRKYGSIFILHFKVRVQMSTCGWRGHICIAKLSAHACMRRSTHALMHSCALACA
eukprot:6208401-Pleurochrysis_carterae.AAC.1